MTTTESRMTAAGPAPLIEELFCQGHPLDHVLTAGEEIGWTRDDVNAVLRDRQWDLDGSGRLPRSKRITAPRGLRAARPTAPPSPPSRGRRVVPAEKPQRALVDTPIDNWDDSDDPAVDLVPDDAAAAEPPAAPAAAQPPAVVFSAIAEWADSDVAADGPAPGAVPEPAPKAGPRPVPARPSAKDPSDAIVERFLTVRTVPAADDQFLTNPQLREAFEEWRATAGTAGALQVTPRRFGMALSARYPKRQATVVIDGVKPICYFGLALQPAPAERPVHEAPASAVEVALLEEARASTALDGETQVIGGAYTAATPRPADQEVTPEPAVTVEQVAEVHGELVAAATEAPPDVEPTAAPLADQTLDLLAVGLTHSDRRVRSAAIAVERAVDVLCAALSRAVRRG